MIEINKDRFNAKIIINQYKRKDDEKFDDRTLKQEMGKLFSELGLDATKAVRERKLPFGVALSPTKNTEMEELERRLGDIKTKKRR